MQLANLTEHADSQKHTEFAKHKALLIEDMAEARLLQRKMLSDFGFKTIEIAMKAETAVDLLKSQTFDVILSDYNLGNGKDGQQLLEEVRHSKLIPHTATYLMVTAETSIEMVMGAIEYQPDGYITKPFSQAVLQRRLEKLLEMKAKLKKVNQALDANDFSKAIEEAQNVMANHPSLEGKCQRIIGESYLEMKAFEKAKSLFNEILQTRKMPWALFGEARACFYLDQFELAESKFRQLMLDNRFFVSAYDWLAKIKTAQKDYVAAQAIISDALERSPKNILRQIELGKLSLKIDDFVTAEVAFRRAVSLAKHSCYDTPEVYLNHLYTFTELAKKEPFSSRQKETFQATLKKIHALFFEDPSVRAKTYSYEIQAYLNQGDKNNSKNTFHIWINDANAGVAQAPTQEQMSKYQLAFGG